MDEEDDQQQNLSITDILSGAQTINRELEALQREHNALITKTMLVEEDQFLDEAEDDEYEDDSTMLQRLRKDKLQSSLDKLENGHQETNLLLVVASYINSLEADRAKLKSQVRRLCEENGWLRQELIQHQQQLSEMETKLGKMQEEKKQLEFVATLPSWVEKRKSNEELPLPNCDEEGTDPDNKTSDVVEAEGSGVDRNLKFTGNNQDRFQSLHQRAINHMNQGRHDVAVSLCKKAAQEVEHSLGRYHPDRANLLNVIVVIYREQGKFREAVKLLQEVLEVREHSVGKDHQSVASTLNNLSLLHGKCGEFRQAVPLCRRALEIKQKRLGAHHPDVAQQLINLASFCQHLGNYEEVEWYYQRALEIYQTEFGPDDPNVVKTLNYLGKCYMKQGKLEAAETIFTKVRGLVQVQEAGSRESRDQSPAWLREEPQMGSPNPTTAECDIRAERRAGHDHHTASTSSMPVKVECSPAPQQDEHHVGSPSKISPRNSVSKMTGGRPSVSANVLKLFRWGSGNSVDSSSGQQ